jgi:hypothetical protein
MKHSILLVGFSIVLATAFVGQGSGKAKIPPAQGAVQMPGDNGKVGTPYLLGRKGEELVFTLEKAEFASRAFLAFDARFPAEKQRLLVLTYAVQNPGTSDRPFFDQSFSFTVVSPDDQNFVCDGIAGNGAAAIHPDRRDRLNLQLKPAQKVRAIAVISMHPKGPVNKLIVQRGKGTPVLRYDLKEKVKPMTGAFADNGGNDMREVGSALMTQVVDLGPWDVTIEKMADEPGPIGEFSPDTGQKYVVLTVAVKNAALTPYPLNDYLIITKMTDADGSDIGSAQHWVKGSTPEAFPAMTVEPGAQVRFRMLFHTGLQTKAEKVMLSDQQYSVKSAVVKLN